jgi:hypothetical protein
MEKRTNSSLESFVSESIIRVPLKIVKSRGVRPTKIQRVYNIVELELNNNQPMIAVPK